MTKEEKSALNNTQSVFDEFKHRIAEAFESQHNELKELVEQERTSIIEHTQEEAMKIITEAREKAAEITDDAQHEAEAVLSETKKQAQKERDEIVANITTEARRKAECDAARLFAEAKEMAQNLIEESIRGARAMLAESSRLVTEAQQKLEQAITQVQGDFNQLNEQSLTLSTETGSTTPVEGFGDERTYRGRLELHVFPPITPEQLADFERSLAQVPHLRLIDTGSSSNGGAWFLTELPQPIPMLKLLKEIPLVKEAACYKNDIGIALRGKERI